MAKPIYIELHVRNQMIVGVHKLPRLIVEGSKQFVYLMIDFDEEWSDSSISVIFSHDSSRRKTVSLSWHGEALEVPQELLIPGGLRISCVGHANDGAQRLTTHYMSDPIRIYRAGPLEGDEVQNAPAPLWEQTLAAVGSLGFLKTEDRSSAVAAINEIFGLSIAKIEQDAASDKENVITITLQNGETKKFVIRNGSDHAKLLNRDADDQHPISAVSGLRAELDDKQPKGSYLTEETDPTVPAWAKQPEKPAYTAAEVHALPDTYTPPVDATLTQSGQAADAKATGDALRSLSEEIVDVKGATVGQIIKVSAVDDTGKPTAWEPATPPSKLTDFKNDLYFSKEELFLTLTKNDFEYDEVEGWASYVSNPNTTLTEDGNGFAYKVNVSIGGKTYTNSGTYSDFKMKDSDPPNISEFFSTDDQSDFIETNIDMLGGYNVKTDYNNYSGFSIIIDDYDVTWLDVDDFTLELYRIKYKKISIDTIDFGDFFDRLTYRELEVVDERIVEQRKGGYMFFPLIYISGLGFYAAMGRYSTKSLDRSKQMRQYTIDPNVIGYKISLDVGKTYTNTTTNKMRIYEAGNSTEMSADDIFVMSRSSGSGNIIFDATINGTKVRSVACQSLYNVVGSTDFKAYAMLADDNKLYSICAERVGTNGTISVKRLM